MIYGINSEKESKKSEMHLSRCKLLFHLKDSEVHEWRHSKYFPSAPTDRTFKYYTKDVYVSSGQ